MRGRAAGALLCALAMTCAAAPAVAEPQATIAFLPTGAGETRPLLQELAARGMAIGMVSPTVGKLDARQVGLDMSQGSRIPSGLYSGPIGTLELRAGRLAEWELARRRADKAPGDLVPGLLASTVGGVGFAGDRASPARIVAANEAGRVSPLAGSDRLAVVGLEPGRAGLRQLDSLLAARGPDGFVFVMRAPYGKKLRLLPGGIAAPGIHGQLRSATTRRNGLIAATDVAPTVLDALGIRVPNAMQGQKIEGRGSADPKAVEEMAARLTAVTSRRGVTLLVLLGVWLVTAALLVLVRGRRGLRAAARIGLLGALWLPALALLAAALEPSRLAEALLVGAGSVGLAALTDALLPWPGGPAVPALVVFAAHTVDLARGSPLIGQSIAGSNPAGGARFFGIGNELEVLLSVTVLVGTGAALSSRNISRRAPLVFASAAVVAAVIMGAGRLGADVGAVITLGAGGAAAVIASLPARPSRRAIGLAVAAPILAVGLLVLLDLATGGGAHLTRSVVHSHGSGNLADVARRRVEGSLSTLGKPGWAIASVLAAAALIWLALRRNALLEGVPRAFGAGLVGSWFAVVVGALANDSGPLILVVGTICLLLAAGYARGRPVPVIEPR